jgi:hypothetical protein
VRKVREGETTNDVFAFLTINPNAEVGAIHLYQGQYDPAALFAALKTLV